MRSSLCDPEDDEEYYRKQLSYFDRRGFDSKPTHLPASHGPEPAKPSHPHPQTMPGFSSYTSK